MMVRRTHIAMIAGVVLVSSLAAVLVVSVVATSLPAEAQQAGKVARLGWLINGSSSPASPDMHNRNAFLGQLRDLGYVEGQNLIIERRYAEGQMERHRAFIDELVRLKVDVLLASGDQVIQRVKDATSDIPIVMVACDALATGLISSLAHPGGNLTGVTCITSDLSAKRADLLHQAVPTLQRLAILYNPADPHAVLEMKHTREIAEAWKVRLQPLEVRDGDQLETRFALMKQEQASAVLTIGDNLTLFHRSRIVQLAAKNRLPAMYGFREFADAGGLISYGPDLREMFRQAAFYVDKILKGARSADLPVEQPTKFELVINLKTAKALGLTIPPSLLGRADEVIQ
jgi:putative ABC transport system substrate-binding protein